MNDEDPNKLLKLEKAIIQRWGEEAVKNPKTTWTIEKEKEYLSQIKALYEKEYKEPERIEVNGVCLPQRLFINENSKVCISCRDYSLKREDALYLFKYQCCYRCYLLKVEGREDKWQKKLSQENK